MLTGNIAKHLTQFGLSQTAILPVDPQIVTRRHLRFDIPIPVSFKDVHGFFVIVFQKLNLFAVLFFQSAAAQTLTCRESLP